MSPPTPGLSRICYSEGIKKDHIHLFRVWAKKKKQNLTSKFPIKNRTYLYYLCLL